jgi:hypothetical protein
MTMCRRYPAAMRVETIFRQLHDPATWPPPPERPLRPASVSDLRPAPPLIPVPASALAPWTAPAEDTEG